MAANLTKPFAESCCDGGEGPTATSCQPCGCDKGANHLCQLHRDKADRAWTKYTGEDPPVEDTKRMSKLNKHYKEVVETTWNKANRCSSEKDHFLNAAMGLAGEAGEVLDCHKKHFYHRPKDYKQEVLLELGDVIYYFLKVKKLWGFNMKQILKANRDKLFQRYEIK